MKIPPINPEWYKQDRWSYDPDLLGEDLAHNYGEFSLSYQIAFEKHLNAINKNIMRNTKGNLAVKAR